MATESLPEMTLRSGTTTGTRLAALKSGSVVPSMVRVSVTAGSSESGEMTCGAAPGRSNSIRSGPGVAFAFVMAFRSV
ncbi:MAG TPA: hypothetical protein VNN79_22890 [Actinomycetota bacterium]|nr:hypothetical protein [Actinomycetota bacterium]